MSTQTPKETGVTRQGVPRLSSHRNPAGQNNVEDPKAPKRAKTFDDSTLPQRQDSQERPDTFETADNSDVEDPTEGHRGSVDLDELPIELVTLTDSFIESLSAKKHSAPPSIESVSRLFQDFYQLASTHINTHISALATRQSRGASPAPSGSSISSATSRFRSKAASIGAKDKPKVEEEQQMITAQELANRKQARKALEAKRGVLEEAVERRLCEGIYDKIYRHRTTQDEAQDAKLRSKTAALALVGIGPVDLGVDYGEEAAEDPSKAAKITDHMRGSLEEARNDLVKMGECRYPMGKANHLKAAHKSIVDTLAHFHPSASADEIMPMLIYTLLTLPPGKLHAISDLHFIQYFRWEPKLTGEAAYCLTNLEAAISFLQTVDLSTLRADEHPSGPPKTEGQATATQSETFAPAYSHGITEATQSATEANTEGVTASKPAPSPGGLRAANVLRNRRLSDLVNTPAQAFGAASDAVFSTADQGLKTISTSLGDSYSFLLGKLRERQQGPKDSNIVVPRTLDDARKLVSTPPPSAVADDEDDDAASSTAGSAAGVDADYPAPKRPAAREDRVLSLIGGRRDPSVDSARSGGSAKKVAFNDDTKAVPSTTAATAATAALDQVRNLGSSFNPIGRLSSIGMIRGFGRSSATSSPAPSGNNVPTDGGDLASAFPDIAAALPPASSPGAAPSKILPIPTIAPPNKRFLELQSPADLKLGEVRELVKEYKRLATHLKNLGAFEEK